MNEPPVVLINPVMRWAVVAGDAGSLAQIDGLPPVTLPHVDEVLTVPCLVDPTTRLAVPVQVLAIRTLWDGQRHTLAVVVARHRPH